MSRIFAGLLLITLTTLAGSAQAAAPSKSALVWRGDLATSRALMSSLGKAWTRTSHTPITLQPFSTISGIDAALDGKADFAGSARPPFAKRTQEAGLTFTPIAWDGIALITHRNNPVKNVSLRQLNDIYYGRITNWQALGGPNLPIHLYAVASPLDGVEFSLRKYLYGRGNQPVIAPRLYINTQQLEDAVVLDPSALGASTMSSVMGNRKLQMLDVAHVAPTPATIADGSYPLAIPLYLAVAPHAERYAAVEDFLTFLGTQKAQKIMREHHVVPYDGNQPLAQNYAQHLADVEQASHFPRNGPVAAPGATYASKAAIAPTSKLTAEAYQRMLKARKLDAAKATPSVKPATTASVNARPSH